MAFTRYVRPSEQEAIYLPQIQEKLTARFHTPYPTEIRKFVDHMLSFLDEQPYDVAFLDGVLAGTPGQPDRFTAFTKPEQWDVEHHVVGTILPYFGSVRPCSPLLQMVRHQRRYIGPSQHDEFVDMDHGTVQDFLMLYFARPMAVYGLTKTGQLTPMGSIGDGSVSAVAVDPAEIERTAGEIANRIERIPRRETHPWRFGATPFFIVGSNPDEDVNTVAEFEVSSTLTFIRHYQRPGSNITLFLNF